MNLQKGIKSEQEKKCYEIFLLMLPFLCDIPLALSVSLVAPYDHCHNFIILPFPSDAVIIFLPSGLREILDNFLS